MGVNNLVPVKLQVGTSYNDNMAFINNNFQAISDAFNPLIISDGSVNRIIIGRNAETDEYNISYYDTNGVLVCKIDGADITYYDTSGNTVCIINGDKTVYYDSSDARILIGKAPDDGRIGIWVSKTGVDVVTELGG